MFTCFIYVYMFPLCPIYVCCCAFLPRFVSFEVRVFWAVNRGLKKKPEWAPPLSTPASIPLSRGDTFPWSAYRSASAPDGSKGKHTHLVSPRLPLWLRYGRTFSHHQANTGFIHYLCLAQSFMQSTTIISNKKHILIFLIIQIYITISFHANPHFVFKLQIRSFMFQNLEGTNDSSSSWRIISHPHNWSWAQRIVLWDNLWKSNGMP